MAVERALYSEYLERSEEREGGIVGGDGKRNCHAHNVFAFHVLLLHFEV